MVADVGKVEEHTCGVVAVGVLVVLEAVHVVLGIGQVAEEGGVRAR